jgi:hypothetical protein
MRFNWYPDSGKKSEHTLHFIGTCAEQFNITGRVKMAKVIYEGDDFKRMLRKDMLKLQQLGDAKKFGIFEVDHKEGKIKVEIKRRVMISS